MIVTRLSPSSIPTSQVRDAALPNSKKYVLPYIYNHFQWPHCDSVNVTFPRVGSKFGIFDDFCSDDESDMQIIKGTFAFNTTYLDATCTAKAAKGTNIMRYAQYDDGSGLRNAQVSMKFTSSGPTEVSVNGYGRYKHDGSIKWLEGFACSKMGQDTTTQGRLLIEYKVASVKRRAGLRSQKTLLLTMVPSAMSRAMLRPKIDVTLTTPVSATTASANVSVRVV